jgi:hypothetical protein
MELRVPGPEHALLIAIAHGLKAADGDPNGDWIVDACRILDAGPLDWDLFVVEARERLLQAILHAGLTYLAGELGRTVPRQVLARLAADRDAQLDAELDDYATNATTTMEPFVQRGFAMALRRFARGTSLPQPINVASTPAATSAVELSPEAHSFWVRLGGGLGTGWIVVRVGLDVPVAELHGDCQLHVRLPGLPVAIVRLEPPRHVESIWRTSIQVPLHCGFLGARAIDRLGILLLRDGEPLLWPGRRSVKIDVFAAGTGN